MALDLGAIPEALPGGVARADFNTMRGIVNGSFPLQSVDLGNDQVITTKILDDNVTPVKIAGGYGLYVPRAVNVPDFTQASNPPFVGNLDGAWHVNALDLTAILPADVIAVHLATQIKDNAVGSRFSIRRDAAAGSYNLIQARTQVANVETAYANDVIMIDSNYLLDFFCENLLDILYLVVCGWFVKTGA